jgi:hypothetical protein
MSYPAFDNPDYQGAKEGAKPLQFKQCGGKNIYSKREAHKMKEFIGRTRDKGMRIYECHECNGYHITKKGYD